MSGILRGAGARKRTPAARRVRAALATLLLAGLAGTTWATAASGPSFDCARAHTPVERAICAAPRLALLDGLLGRDYARSRGALPPGERACLASDQRAWLAQRDACDTDVCLEQAYLRRLQALQGLLPGMAVDRRLEGFPSVGDARLLAILPAGHASGIPEDELQDVILEGSPLEDEGGYLLVDGVFDLETWHAFLDLQGDIEAIRARFGEGPVHVPGIVGGFGAGALDDRARAAIETVAGGGDRLRVIGRAAYTDATAPLVDGGHCAFVYVLGRP